MSKLDGIPSDTNVIYYRLYLDKNNCPCVVTLQLFDENDYHSDRWLTSDRWGTEAEAIDALVPFRLAWLSGLGVKDE